MQNLTISQLANIVGVPPKTIRFYEAEGIITPAQRATNGYRLYSTSAAEELKLIKHARDLGLPLSEIKKLIKGCQEKGCHHTQQYIYDEINQYLNLLEDKIAQFRNLQSRLQQLQKNLSVDEKFCKQGKYCCNILHQLAEDVEGGETK